MQMNGQGAKAWEELTGEHIPKKVILRLFWMMWFILQGVSTGPISGGRSEISGAFDVTQTKDLANKSR
jgi:SecD/SecF fusion protein